MPKLFFANAFADLNACLYLDVDQLILRDVNQLWSEGQDKIRGKWAAISGVSQVSLLRLTRRIRWGTGLEKGREILLSNARSLPRRNLPDNFDDDFEFRTNEIRQISSNCSKSCNIISESKSRQGEQKSSKCEQDSDFWIMRFQIYTLMRLLRRKKKVGPTTFFYVPNIFQTPIPNFFSQLFALPNIFHTNFSLDIHQLFFTNIFPQHFFQAIWAPTPFFALLSKRIN